MIFGSYRELFAAMAASSGALTGLLFVALSVAPRRGPGSAPAVIREVRAAAALLAFTNALAVSLFGLVPGTNVGYPAVSLGVIGLFFTAAGMRSILSSQPTRSQNLGQLGLVTLLLAIFGTELAAGIVVLADPHRSTPVQVISYALVTSTIVGIARAWELVGDRNTGLFASIAVLAGHPPSPNGTPAPEATATPRPATPQHADLTLIRHANVASNATLIMAYHAPATQQGKGLACGHLTPRLCWLTPSPPHEPARRQGPKLSAVIVRVPPLGFYLPDRMHVSPDACRVTTTDRSFP